MVGVAGEASAAPTTWYVTQGGTGTGCTSPAVADACPTVSAALGLAAPGDTIEVSGTIEDNVEVTAAEGTATQPVSIVQAPGGAAAVVEAPAGGLVFTIDTDAGADLDGLTIENGQSLKGGGILNSGTLAVTDSVITGNSAEDAEGGGINNDETGQLTVTDSTISDNQSVLGAGILNDGSATVTGSTIFDNQAEGGGTGAGIWSLSQLTVSNSTIWGNTSSGTFAQGGGIEVEGGDTTVLTSTIADNTVTGTTARGAGIYDVGSITVGGSIVAGNTGGNCYNAADHAISSDGYDLTDDAAGTDCGFTQSTDVAGADPELGLLEANGGPTDTALPAFGSPAADAIPEGTVLDGTTVCPGTDQRGASRPYGTETGCTIGATEAAPGAAPAITSPAATTFTEGSAGTFTVTTTGVPVAAISDGDAVLPAGVTFVDNGNGTATLAGTPAVGSAGTYPLPITAANGFTPIEQAFAAPGANTQAGADLAPAPVPATQTLILTVVPAATTPPPTTPPPTMPPPGAPSTSSGGPLLAATPNGAGYWLASSDGGVTTYGTAPAEGSMTGTPLNAPVVGIAGTPDGHGYWLVAADGGVFAFGDARFYGSAGGIRLNQPVVALASTPDGGGYWLVAADGGVFAFGDARFYGSTGGLRLNQPIVDVASTPDGGGYWLAAADGGVFAFGDARFYGSSGALRLNRPVVGVTAAPDGAGYWLVAADGGVFDYGDAGFFGSLGGSGHTIIGLFTTDDGAGYTEVGTDGSPTTFG